MSKLTTALEGEREKIKVWVEDIDCLVENDGYFSKEEMTRLVTKDIFSSNARVLSVVLEWAKENSFEMINMQGGLREDVVRVSDLSQFIQEGIITNNT